MVSPAAKVQINAGPVPSSVLGAVPMTPGLLDSAHPAAPASQAADYVYRIAALTAGLVFLGSFL